MKSRFKQLGKDSIIYGLGGMISKGIGFLLLPIYTRIFNPADYGTIEMLIVLNSFLGTLLVMGMDSAQSFYFFENKSQGIPSQAKMVTAILQWKLAWGTIIVIVATLLSPLLNHFFFNGHLSWEYFALAFAGSFFTQIMSQSVEIYRLLYRPLGFISVTLGQTVLAATLALILIVCYDFGILGFFWGSLIGAILAALFGWWRVRIYLDLSQWHIQWWPRLMKFGAPLLPAGFAMYVLNTSDRWFINHFNNQEALGLYAVGAKFAMLISLAVVTFRQAWWPVAMDAINSEDGPILFRTIGRLYLGCGSAAVVVISAFSPYLVRWFTVPAYFLAYPIIGVLSWSGIFLGFYLIVAGGIWRAERTAWAPLLMGTAALLNIGLNAWLVPVYGGIGAATATSISFCIWNVLTLIVSEKLWRVNYDYGIMMAQVGIGAIACILTLHFYSYASVPWYIWPINFFAIIILVILSFSRKHLNTILEYARFKKIQSIIKDHG